MTDFHNRIYNRIQALNKEVKTKLKRKGLVLPVKDSNGLIRIGKYYIQKQNNLYTIKDISGSIIVSNINLPYSAITIANNLAMTNYVDKWKLEIDSKYGAAHLDKEILNKKAKIYIQKNRYDQAEILLAKSSIAHYKAENYRNAIIEDFEKLLRIDK
jgi:hypothetical protein